MHFIPLKGGMARRCNTLPAICKEHLIVTQVVLSALYHAALSALVYDALVLLKTPELLLRPILLFLVNHQIRADPLCVSELMPSAGNMPRLGAN